MRSVTKMLMLFRTLRHLRFEQVFFRIYYRIRRLKLRVVPTLATQSWLSTWEAPKVMTAGMLGLTEFMFLGKKDSLICADDWNAFRSSKLWLYNLHYFDDLNAVEAKTRKPWHIALINRWIKENPPLCGVGWEPYTLSLRIVNWIKWFSLQDEVNQPWLDSLALQAQALERQLEFHILGNHLFANAKALVFAGCYLEGSQAECWLNKGLKILDREIKEQFLADGGHFELSPMYHAIMLWDLCDLVNLARTSNVSFLKSRFEDWEDIIVRGLSWLSAMTHPDGEISFFNDAAFGIAPKLSDIRIYAEQLQCRLPSKIDEDAIIRTRYLGSSGYVVIESGRANKAILDTARVGPDYQPGHAHADTLSFELSLFGQRVFVNSGTSMYGECAERSCQRGTRSHNTVVLDNEDSSEIWSSFRVARRAYPKDVMLKREASSVKVRCAHNGYRRLRGRNIHTREWFFSENSLLITDTVTGRFGEAEARLYLHPDVELAEKDARSLYLLLSGGRQVNVNINGHDNLMIENTIWHPYFGIAKENRCIVVRFSSNNLQSSIEW